MCTFLQCKGASLVHDGAHSSTLGASLHVMTIFMIITCRRCMACTACTCELPTCPVQTAFAAPAQAAFADDDEKFTAAFHLR